MPRISVHERAETPFVYMMDNEFPRQAVEAWLEENIFGEWRLGQFRIFDFDSGRSHAVLGKAVQFRSIVDAELFETNWRCWYSVSKRNRDDDGNLIFTTPDWLPFRFMIPHGDHAKLREWLKTDAKGEWKFCANVPGGRILAIGNLPDATILRLKFDLQPHDGCMIVHERFAP